MRDSIWYSALRSLAVAFCAVLGVGLGFIFLSIFIGAFSSSTNESKLTTIYTEEILPNADGVREALSSSAPVVLQIRIDGVIGAGELTMETIKQQLIESREGDFKDNRVKAILLYINTPGGTVVDADGIYRALKTYKEQYHVPIYAYVDGLCASGGMYVASAADKIYASDASIIGSVGVLAPTVFNVSKLMTQYGIESLTLTAGKEKDALNPFRPWKKGEETNYQSVINYYYNHFVNIVTTNRPKVNKEKLVQDYGAMVFVSPEAQEKGYIDVSDSSHSEALKDLVKQAGITEGEKYQFIQLANKNWWNSLFKSDSTMFSGKVKVQLDLSPDMDPNLQNKYLYLYRP